MRGTWWIGTALVLVWCASGMASATANLDAAEPAHPDDPPADDAARVSAMPVPDAVHETVQATLEMLNETVEPVVGPVLQETVPASQPVPDPAPGGSSPPRDDAPAQEEGDDPPDEDAPLPLPDPLALVPNEVPPVSPSWILPEVRPYWDDAGAAAPQQGPPAPATQTLSSASEAAVPVRASKVPAEIVVAATAATAVAVAAASGASLTNQASLMRPFTWLRRVLGIGLFSRLAKGQVLDHDKRQVILDHVRANPGTCVTQIQVVVEMSINAVTHHLRVLEANGLVKSVKSGRRRCFFATGTGISLEDQMATATLSSEATRRVFAVIERQPGIRQQQLAAVLDITPTSVMFHTRRLEEAGIVRRARSGRALTYFPEGVRA